MSDQAVNRPDTARPTGVGADAPPVITVSDDDTTAVRRTLADSAPTTLGARVADWVRHIRGRGALEIGLIFVVVQAGCIAAYLAWPQSFPYLGTANLNLITQSVPVISLLAIAAGLLMTAGEFDLSIGSMFTMTGLVFLTWYGGGANPVAAFAVAIAVGVGIALVNGFLTTRFRIPSFIVTLGAMLFWDGASLWYTDGGTAIISRGPLLESVFAGKFLGVRAPMWWLLGIGIVVWLLVHRHRLGNHLTAVGGNEAAAKAISINPTRIKLVAWAMLGGLVAFASILSVVRVQSMTPGTGIGLELQAIAAAVVGGVSLRGGKGSVLGMVLGAALIFTIQDILLLGGAPGFYLDVFIGVIIVGAAIFNRLIEGKSD